eukprot:6205836-Ditylum_brightwellii.AAC.1
MPQDNLEELGDIDVTGDKRTKFAVSNLTSYTNTKTRVANAGKVGQIFAGCYKDLTTEDITKIFGIFILDGLNPSPQIQRKMKSPMVDKVQGNNFIASSITGNAERKSNSFHHFFAVQDTITTPPPKEKCPNYKVDSLFR